MTSKPLTSFSLRPCISTRTELARAEFMNRIQSAVESADGFQGKFRTGHAMISIIESKRHFWSPWMHLEYREQDEHREHGQTNSDPPLPRSADDEFHETNAMGSENQHEENVIARFSPHPSIWTGFMLTYLSLIVLIFFSFVLGYSQQLAQQSPWGYYLLPVWVLVGVGLWAASQIGQRWAVDEMQELISIVENCLETNEKKASK